MIFFLELLQFVFKKALDVLEVCQLRVLELGVPPSAVEIGAQRIDLALHFLQPCLQHPVFYFNLLQFILHLQVLPILCFILVQGQVVIILRLLFNLVNVFLNSAHFLYEFPLFLQFLFGLCKLLFLLF